MNRPGSASVRMPRLTRRFSFARMSSGASRPAGLDACARCADGSRVTSHKVIRIKGGEPVLVVRAGSRLRATNGVERLLRSDNGQERATPITCRAALALSMLIWRRPSTRLTARDETAGLGLSRALGARGDRFRQADEVGLQRAEAFGPVQPAPADRGVGLQLEARGGGALRRVRQSPGSSRPCTTAVPT